MKAPKSSGKTHEKHPEGWTTLVCTRIIDKGTVFSEKKQKDVHNILLQFESSKLLSDGEAAGKPFAVFATFPFSMFTNSMLCKFIEQWRGKKFKSQEDADEFDVATLLGKGGFANITYNGDFVNIGTSGPVPDGMTQPIPIAELLIWDFATRKPAVLEKLSDGMKGQLQKANEWDSEATRQPQANRESENPAPGIDDSDIPF